MFICVSFTINIPQYRGYIYIYIDTDGTIARPIQFQMKIYRDSMSKIINN